MRQSLLSLVWHNLFGYRYYIVIYLNVGTSKTCIGGIFPTYKKAKASSTRLSALVPVEIRSFRSYNKYNLDIMENIEWEEDGTLNIL